MRMRLHPTSSVCHVTSSFSIRWPWIRSRSPLVDQDNPIPSSTHISPVREFFNKDSDWHDVMGNGNLHRRIVRHGNLEAATPCYGCLVKMSIEGWLPSGDIIEQSTLWFVVGYGEVIKAIDMVALEMKEGEVCQMKTSPCYAYGAQGNAPNVPPNSSLLYELELLVIQEPIDFSAITEPELLSYLQRDLNEGEELSKQKKNVQSIKYYKRVVTRIDSFKEHRIEETSSELNDIWMRCHSNLAAALNMVGKTAEALDTLEKILQADPWNVQALYESGKIMCNQDKLDEAITRLRMAADLTQDNQEILLALKRAMEKQNVSTVNQMWTRFTEIGQNWSWTMIVLATLAGLLACRLMMKNN